MITEELKNYLDQLEFQGQFDEDIIRQQLVGVGWDSLSVEQAIEYLRNHQATTPDVVSVADASLSTQNGIGQKVLAERPAQAKETTSQSNVTNLSVPSSQNHSAFNVPNTFSPNRNMATDIAMRKSPFAKIFTLIVIGLLVLCSIGTLVYAHANHLWIFAPIVSNGPYKSETILSDIIAGQKQIKEYGFDVKISASAGVRDQGAVPIKQPLLLGANSTGTVNKNIPAISRMSLPANFSLDIGVNGKVSLPSAGDADFLESEINLGGVYAISSTTSLSLKLGFIRTKAESFAKIIELPSIAMMFFNAAPILNKWVKLDISTSTISSYSGYAGSYTKDINVGTSTDKKILAEQLNLIIKVIDEQGLISIFGKPQETVGDKGEKFFKYQLIINWDKLSAVYQQSSKTLSDTYGDKAIIKDDPKVLASLTEPDTKERFDYLNSNFMMFVSANETGVPVKWELSGRFVPNEDITEYTGKQLNIKFESAISYINLPQNIKAPDVWITMQDAIKLLSPLSPSIKSTSGGLGSPIYKAKNSPIKTPIKF